MRTINMIVFVICTIALYVFTKWFSDVPMWVQENWRWDQAQWMALQLFLIVLWTVWLIATVVTLFIGH